MNATKDPPSLWHATSRNRKDRPPLESDIHADLAIIGGGFSGLSTALHAAERGLSVVVLEAEIIAWGRPAAMPVSWCRISPRWTRTISLLSSAQSVARV